MLLLIKQGVNIAELHPKIVSKLWDTVELFVEYGYDCVITSARRTPGGRFSFHHEGKALDLRANHIKDEQIRAVILDKLRSLWGNEFDIILHGEGDNIHYHLEYDPD